MEETTNTNASQRIETIDVLRGFALAGILYAHMVIWHTGAALPPEVYFRYDSIADYLAMAIFGAFVFGKFFSVFSFLFGLSFYLHFRKKKFGYSYYKIYIWRLSLLFLIGILHHVLWRGDILSIYAVLGLVLILFRKLPPKLLLALSIVLILNLPNHLYDLLEPQLTASTGVSFPMSEQAKQYYTLVKKANFSTVVIENWESWPAKIKYQLESGRLLMTFGYFLLGLYTGSRSLFNGIKTHISLFIRVNKYTEKAVLVLLLIALLVYINGLVSLPEINVVPKYKWLTSFLFDIYNACLTLFFISGITLLLKKRSFYVILKPLGTMGRMALTNYLLQTVFGLLLFYQFGMGFFDKTSPALNVLLGVAIFYLQLKFSQWWLTRFKQGPVEWLWKSLTYFRFTSNRVEGAKKLNA